MSDQTTDEHGDQQPELTDLQQMSEAQRARHATLFGRFLDAAERSTSAAAAREDNAEE
jgi:hypothetical protein